MRGKNLRFFTWVCAHWSHTLPFGAVLCTSRLGWLSHCRLHCWNSWNRVCSQTGLKGRWSCIWQDRSLSSWTSCFWNGDHWLWRITELSHLPRYMYQSHVHHGHHSTHRRQCQHDPYHGYAMRKILPLCRKTVTCKSKGFLCLSHTLLLAEGSKSVFPKYYLQSN